MSDDTPKESGKRTGRRPGKPETRALILEVARDAFIADGYPTTSVRSIARRAGVDQALIHRYFGSKKGLLLAVASIAFDPTEVIAKVAQGGPDGIGMRLAATAMTVWESPAGRRLAETLRSNPGLILPFAAYIGGSLEATRAHLEFAPGDSDLRVSVVQAQMAGMLLGRYVARIEPLASVPGDALARAMAPWLQHVLTGNLRPALR